MPMQDPLFLLCVAACLLVVCVLLAGLFAFLRGGEFHRRYGNLLMRWRVGSQLVAAVLIAVYAWTRAGGGA